MEISHASTETQSAALGILGKAEEVKVSADAEFMMAIAHGIYSNKALAIVRELLCNARDGHNAAGTPDATIQVTLTDNKLVVRDNGTGIPNDKFAALYMTFGGSTKRKMGNQTGGFGVGTKVPWAVCDTFSARNFHNGKMTTYAIMKSDPALDGQPSCTPIMTLDSKEHSGVEVSVPFPEKLHGDLRKYIFAFADELGLNISLNGAVIPCNYDMISELNTHGFVRLESHPLTVIQQTPFYVRLGDVIYPVESQEEFSDAYDLLLSLNPSGARSHPILFLAEPDSVVPTMSRESLSYTDRTQKTIRTLMAKALQVLADKVDDYADRAMKLLPERYSANHDFLYEMWRNSADLPARLEQNASHLRDMDIPSGQHVLLMSNMNRWLKKQLPYLETAKTKGMEFRTKMQKDVEELFLNRLSDYSSYMSYSRLVSLWKDKYILDSDKAFIRNTYEEVQFWRREIDSNPLILDVITINSARDLRYMSGNTPRGYFLEYKDLKKLDKEKEESFRYSSEFLNHSLFVSKVVVIAPTFRTMLERNREQYQSQPNVWSNVLSKEHGNLMGARVLRVKASIKPTEVAELKKFCEAHGYVVHDLSGPTYVELAERAELAAERAKLKEIPLPTLIGMVRENQPTYFRKGTPNYRKQLEHLAENPSYKGQPLYMLLDRGKQLPFSLKTVDQLKVLVKFVGTDITCVSTKIELAKVIKEGRQPVDQVLLELAKSFFRRSNMHEKMYYRGTWFVKRAKQNKYLTQYLFNRLPPQFTDEEERIYEGLLALKQTFPDLAQYMNMKIRLYSKCDPEDHYEMVFTKYAQDHFSDVPRALEKAYARAPSRKRALARSILKSMLKERPA